MCEYCCIDKNLSYPILCCSILFNTIIPMRKINDYLIFYKHRQNTYQTALQILTDMITQQQLQTQTQQQTQTQTPTQMKLKNTLNIIQQVDEKQSNPYDNILSLLTANNNNNNTQLSSHLKPTQTTTTKTSYPNINTSILQQLDNFHEYYSKRHLEYKQNYEKIKKQNWQYAMKLIKYEQALENCQIANYQCKEQLSAKEYHIERMRKEYKGNVERLEQVLLDRDQEIRLLKQQMQSLTSLTARREHQKKRVIKLKQKSIKIDSIQPQPHPLQSARNNRHITTLKQQLQQHITQIQQLSLQNEQLKKKVKHLQKDRKYQDQRLKSATLALQLDLKMKNEQIERLSNQIAVYERKFGQFMQSIKNSHHNINNQGYPIQNQTNYNNQEKEGRDFNLNFNKDQNKDRNRDRNRDRDRHESQLCNNFSYDPWRNVEIEDNLTNPNSHRDRLRQRQQQIQRQREREGQKTCRKIPLSFDIINNHHNHNHNHNHNQVNITKKQKQNSIVHQNYNQNYNYIQNQNQTKHSKVRTHKRHGSSNLEQHRREHHNQQLNLKIKVLRYNNNHNNNNINNNMDNSSKSKIKRYYL